MLSREKGGQLFATFVKGKVLVVRATVVKGASSRFSFWPDRAAEQGQIDNLFTEGLHYVGDWHSHPERQPTPSGPDRQKMVDIFRSSKHELSLMLMAIVGQADFPGGLFLGAVTAQGVTALDVVP